MDAMDAVALGARVQQVADKLLHKAQEARARGNAAAEQSLTESVSDLRQAAAVLVEQKRLLTVRQSTSATDASTQHQPPSSSSGIQESSDAAPRTRHRRNSSTSSIMSMLSTYEVGSVAGSVAGSVHHSHSHSSYNHSQSQTQHQELVARLTRVEKMLGKKSDEMKAKGNESAANALSQSANYVHNGSSFIAEQQQTIQLLTSSQEKLQTQWRALGNILTREEQVGEQRGDDDDADGDVLPRVAAIAAELTALRGFLKTAFPECRDPRDMGELAAALQCDREAAKAVDENSQQLLSADAVKALEAERDHLKQQLAEAKRVYEEEYLIAREDIEILKSEKAMLERQLRAVEAQNEIRNEQALLERQATYEVMMQAKEELRDVVETHKQQLSDLATQAESWKTQFYDEQLKLSESLAANSEHAVQMALMEEELKTREEMIAALEKTLKMKNEATEFPLLESGILTDEEEEIADDEDTKSDVMTLKKLHDVRVEELRVLLSECEESLESERERSERFALERDTLVTRLSEIETDHDSEMEALKSECESQLAEVELQRQSAQDETTKLLETLEKLSFETETRQRITLELKDAVDGYREECFAARKEVEERGVVIARLQERLQLKEESIEDARRQLEAKLSALRSDVQTLCESFESTAYANPEVVTQSLGDLVLENESRVLRDAFVGQMRSYAALKQQFDRVQADEQELREMSTKFLSSCESVLTNDADSAITDIGDRFSRVQLDVAKALDEISFLKESVEKKSDAERVLKQKLGGFLELQQKMSSATDAVHRLELQLETVEVEKIVLASELKELKSKSIDGADREEARAQEVEALELRLKELEADFERYRGRSHTALKKVEKRAELLNGMRKENEQLKKQFEDAEAECQRVLESERRLADSLQEATQLHKMMQEEHQQREVESAKQVVAYEAKLVGLAEEQQIVQRELLKANETLTKLEREKSELADIRNQFYEQERAAQDAELATLVLKYQAKEDEVVALTEDIQELKTQIETQAAELTESARAAKNVQVQLREFENTVARLESELPAVRTTEQSSSSDVADETVKTLQEELRRLQAVFVEEKATSEKKCAEMAAQVSQLKLEAKATEDTIQRLSHEINDKSILVEPAAAQVKPESQVAAVHEAEFVICLQGEKRALESNLHEQEARIAQLKSQMTGYEHRIEFLEEQIRLEEVDSSDQQYEQQQQQSSSATASNVSTLKDEAIRELRHQVLDLQEQLQHFEEEHAARELEQERGELEQIQTARMELQKKSAHALQLNQRKALVGTFKQHLHTVVDELQRGLDDHSAAFRDACEFRDAHSKRKADAETAAAAADENGPLPAEAASTEDSAPVESSRSSDRTSAAAGDEFEEYLIMNSGVVIKAGASFKLPVFCEKKGWRVVWTFTVKEDGADVGFALAAESAGSKSNDDGHKLIVAPERVNTLSGVFNIEDDSGVTLVFEWDNTFSWLNEKTLDYHVSVQEPLSVEKKQIKVQERSLLSSSKQIRDGLAILAAEAASRAQLKSAVDHLRTSEEEKDAYLKQFNARKDDILQQKAALQQQMEELKNALSGMLSEQDEIEDDTRTLLKAWDGADAEREDAETTIRLAETSQFENLAAQLEAQVQTLEQALLSFQDCQ